MILKAITLLLITASILSAKPHLFSRDYALTYGSLIHILSLHTTIIIDEKNNYTIRVKAVPKGVVKLLVGREEIYKSEGIYDPQEQLFRPKVYTKEAIYTKKKNVKKAFFYENNKSISGLKTSYKKSGGKWQMVSQRAKAYKEWMDNDIVSMLYNLGTYAKRIPADEALEMKALDANKKGGFVSLFSPTPKTAKEVAKNLDLSDQTLIHLNINQPIYKTKKGKFVLALSNEDHYFEHGILKNVLLFGDVKIQSKPKSK